VNSSLRPLGFAASDKFFSESLSTAGHSSKMPKVQKGKRNNAHADAAAKTKAAHSIFKMNTDIGQHVLKNPGIAEQ
jgi:hypothetical protein